jgi:hypothetical protein
LYGTLLSDISLLFDEFFVGWEKGAFKVSHKWKETDSGFQFIDTEKMLN